MNAENRQFRSLFCNFPHFFITDFIYSSLETPLKRQQEKTKRLAHCGIILRLLKENSFVSTRDLAKISYSHTARITELRQGKYDGKEYIIRSVRSGGCYGFCLVGYLLR